MIRDTSGTLSDVDFAVELGKEFNADSHHQKIDSEIAVKPTPIVCQDETQVAKKALEEFIIELEKNLTFEDWLWKATQADCQEIGLNFIEQRKAYEA